MTELITMDEAIKLDLENLKSQELKAEEKLFNYFDGVAQLEYQFLEDDIKGIDFVERFILALKIYAERKTQNPESSIYKSLCKLVDYLEEDRQDDYFDFDFTFRNVFTKEYTKELGKFMASETVECNSAYPIEIIKDWSKKAEEVYKYSKMVNR